MGSFRSTVDDDRQGVFWLFASGMVGEMKHRPYGFRLDGQQGWQRSRRCIQMHPSHLDASSSSLARRVLEELEERKRRRDTIKSNASNVWPDVVIRIKGSQSSNTSQY